MRSLALALVFFAGCAAEESDECARVRVDCPNERSLETECRVVQPQCPATARALFLCMAAHQVCDGAGKLDRERSLAFCKEESDVNDRCFGVSDATVDAPTDAGIDTFAPDTTDDATTDSTVEDASPADAKTDAKTDVKAG